MAAPETRIKNKLNTRDKKIQETINDLLNSEGDNLPYRRLTFGPYSDSGLADRVVSWGSATLQVEVKANNKKPTPLQKHKMEEGGQHGLPGLFVIGDSGVDNYYKDVLDLFSHEAVEERIAQYREDCGLLAEALEKLCDKS